MKLASLKRGGRDGTLVMVSRDMTRMKPVSDGIAPTLQVALERWNEASHPLERLSHELESGASIGVMPYDPKLLASPLPRAYQWADGSAYVVHVELVRQARGAELPASFWTEPLMYQGGSDGFLGPTDPIPLGDEAWGCDFEAEVAVITADVPMGTTAADAAGLIRFVMLCNDVSLRNLIPGELAKGFGFFQSKPASAFSPVAVTPDSLGEAWDGGKLNLPLRSELNGVLFGEPHAGTDMVFDFPALIAHAARTRALAAGTIIGSGTVANRDRSRGSSCIAERRMIETIESGTPTTPFLRWGDRVRIEMLDEAGVSIFGAIDQQVAKP